VGCCDIFAIGAVHGILVLPVSFPGEKHTVPIGVTIRLTLSPAFKLFTVKELVVIVPALIGVPLFTVYVIEYPIAFGRVFQLKVIELEFVEL
jgi:hypothetical protein